MFCWFKYFLAVLGVLKMKEALSLSQPPTQSMVTEIIFLLFENKDSLHAFAAHIIKLAVAPRESECGLWLRRACLCRERRRPLDKGL